MVDHGRISTSFRPFRATFRSSGRNLGLKGQEAPLGDHQVGQPEKGVQLRRVLGQPFIANLPCPSGMSGAFRKSRKFGGLIVMDFLRRFSSAAFL